MGEGALCVTSPNDGCEGHYEEYEYNETCIRNADERLYNIEILAVIYASKAIRRLRIIIIIIIIIMSIYIPHISHGFMAFYNSIRVRSDVSISPYVISPHPPTQTNAHKDRPQHREPRPLLFTNSEWVL